MSRHAPPPLEVQYPLCSICGNEVSTDGDAFECRNCSASWPDTGIGANAGRWDDPDAERCAAIDGRFLPGGAWARSTPDAELYRCVLAADHEVSNHEYTDGFGYAHRSWPDEASATSEQVAAVTP